MVKHLRQRYRTWYARMIVPQDVRAAVGKSVLEKSLDTSDVRVAEAKVMAVVSQWKLEILTARGIAEAGKTGDTAAVTKLAIELKQYTKDTAHEPPIEGVGFTNAEAVAEDIADDLPDDKQRKAFYDTLYGRATPFTALLDDYISTYQVEDKTKAMAKSFIEELAKEFKTVEVVSRRTVQNWIRQDERENSTLSKNLGFVRSYWTYLQEQEVVPETSNPFAQLQLKSKAKAKKAERAAFTAEQVYGLWKAAEAIPDHLLADLIRLAAHTGARLEEICCLKKDDVVMVDGIQCFRITDAKTTAGNRAVPVHPDVAEVVDRLLAESKDGYLIHSQSVSKYGDRSNAIGKRFGRLKTKLGYGDRLVFHSIRKTVVTMLEEAHVPEGVTADIVGHEKKTMTYGLYSAGASAGKKLEALRKLSYKVAEGP